jgi:hypothetical protein
MALNDGRIGWVSARYVDVAGDATVLPVVR